MPLIPWVFLDPLGLDLSKREEWKAGLKLNIQKTKITASGPISSWQLDGEKMETMTDFIFLGSKITADCDCSYEMKRCLLFWRKAMTNLDSVLRNRDITLPTKFWIVKAVFFPVVMFGCKSWTIKKVERQRTDAFELWCWRRLQYDHMIIFLYFQFMKEPPYYSPGWPHQSTFPPTV